MTADKIVDPRISFRMPLPPGWRLTKKPNEMVTQRNYRLAPEWTLVTLLTMTDINSNKPSLFNDCLMTLFVWNRTSNKTTIVHQQQIKNKQMPFLQIEVLRQTEWMGKQMIPTRLPVLGSIAVIVAMIFNCGVAVAGPNETSADYFMPGCRDAASLITFSNVGESEGQIQRQSFCAGIVVGLSFMGQPYGICVPAGTTSQQITSIVVQYIDGQPDRIREDFNHFAVEALRANWPCSMEVGSREPLPVALH
jgi:hypothetical protein